ncbi:MAG: DUF3592 domain-containing protein [Acholeplasmataceae bacterium]|nr:MAG: DUF3592 domain-containing protein [Acholeplasmataceae bacterium]
MSTNKHLSVFTNVFMILAVLLISLTIFLVSRMLWIKSEMHAIDSTIVSITRGLGRSSHTVMISYNYEGQSYTVQYNTYSASMRVGDNITIYIDPDNPDQYYQPNLLTHVLIPGIFALAFGAVGFPMFFSSRKTKKIKNSLMTSGRKMVGTITDLKTNHTTSITVGGRRLFKNHITCRVIDDFSGSEKTYKSRGFWRSSDFNLNIGVSTVDVWVDRQDKEKYFVDFDSIQVSPKETID